MSVRDDEKEDSKEGRETLEGKSSGVNDIIKKILKQQSQLRSHLKRIEKAGEQTSKEDPVLQSPFHQRQRDGKVYILETFLKHIAENPEVIDSHDSGIGSALATITDCSLTYMKDDNECAAVEEQEDPVAASEELTSDQLAELIIELERISDLNAKLEEREEKIAKLNLELDNATKNLNKTDIDNLRQLSEITNLKEQVERVSQKNYKMSHEIKRNDFSLSHMVKNFEGRKAFLNTIELDINRAESYGKRLQKEFEREYETAGLCFNILSASGAEDGASRDKKEVENDNLKDSFVPPNEFLTSAFTISATQNPFGM